MAVVCPGCAREYDVSLFQFGRTVSCTCGSRVGIEPQIEHLESADPRFEADAMLGRLARWLRIVGYDTAYSPDIADGELVRTAIEEGRVLLTRDRGLLRDWRVPRSLLVTSDEPLDQLRQVVLDLGLDWRSGLFSRCSVCSGELELLQRRELGDSVPPGVFRTHRHFLRCCACAKLYWRGSHTERIRRTLEQTFAGKHR